MRNDCSLLEKYLNGFCQVSLAWGLEPLQLSYKPEAYSRLDLCSYRKPTNRQKVTSQTVWTTTTVDSTNQSVNKPSIIVLLWERHLFKEKSPLLVVKTSKKTNYPYAFKQISSFFLGHNYIQEKWRSNNMLQKQVSISDEPWALLISTISSMGLIIFPSHIHMAETSEDKK